MRQYQGAIIELSYPFEKIKNVPWVNAPIYWIRFFDNNLIGLIIYSLCYKLEQFKQFVNRFSILE